MSLTASTQPVGNAMDASVQASVVGVHRHPDHGFSKVPQTSVRLLEGLGVEGDAHCGAMVQHLYLKRKNPHAPNLMQVHLLQSELFDDLDVAGYRVTAGQLGENITTGGIDLLSLPLGTTLHLGDEAVVKLTGLRTPCRKIDSLQPGLMHQMKIGLAGGVPARAGVMGIVLHGGEVCAGHSLRIAWPQSSLWEPLRLL